MSKIVLYPYPRLHDVTWGEFRTSLEDKECQLTEVSDIWDANAQLTFSISVQTRMRDFLQAGADFSTARLVIDVHSRDNAITLTNEARFIKDLDTLSASVTISLPGQVVSEELELHAYIIGPAGDEPWLSRRILADGPQTRVALNSELAGFPTDAFSFANAGIPDAPWRLVITSDDAESTFAHSIRLELNEDYQLVRDLMDGKANQAVSVQLVASITRVLIGTVARMLEGSNDGRSAETVADEAPDSIAAAASRASQYYLGAPLNSAVHDYLLQPERFEYSLACGTDLLRIR